MGNGMETECLRFYAEIGILPTSHLQTDKDINF
jgi:hypothetical protein